MLLVNNFVVQELFVKVIYFIDFKFERFEREMFWIKAKLRPMLLGKVERFLSRNEKNIADNKILVANTTKSMK